MRAPIETQFARMLAGNTKNVRDRGIRKLREWLAARSASGETMFSEDEMMKLWKGLFYCMWMSDKPLIQEELADEMSDMIHCFTSSQASFLFIDCFFKTMNREWFGLDQWRVDKFMIFVRKFLNQCFCLVKRLGWEDDAISSLMDVLKKTVINGRPVEENLDVCLQLHVADIYVEELAKVASKDLSGDKLTAFFVPYCHVLVEAKLPHLVKTIATRVFEFAMRLSDVDIDSKMDDFDNIEDDDGEAYEEEEEEESDDKSLKVLDVEAEWKKIVQKHELRAQELPFPNFDYKAVGDKLLEIVSKCNYIKRNRINIVHRQVNNLYEIAKGIFPLDVVGDELSDSDDEELENKAETDLRKFTEKLYSEDNDYKAMKKNKGKKRKAELFSEINELGEMELKNINGEKKEEEEDRGTSKKKKKKITKSEDDQSDSKPSSCDKLMLRLLKKAEEEKEHKKTVDRAEEQQTIKKKKRKLKKTSHEISEIRADDEITNNGLEQSTAENKLGARNETSKHSNKESVVELIETALENGKELNDETSEDEKETVHETSENGEESVDETSEDEAETVDETSEDEEEPIDEAWEDEEETVDMASEDEEELLDETVETVTSCTKGTPNRIVDKNNYIVNGPKKTEKSKTITLTPKSKQKSVYSNEVIAGNKQKTTPKSLNKKKQAMANNRPKASHAQQVEEFTKNPPLFFKKAVLECTPKSAKNVKNVQKSKKISKRKVNFVLEKNLVHDEKDYTKRFLRSPGVPFDAWKHPVQGVLKSSPYKKYDKATSGIPTLYF